MRRAQASKRHPIANPLSTNLITSGDHQPPPPPPTSRGDPRRYRNQLPCNLPQDKLKRAADRNSVNFANESLRQAVPQAPLPTPVHIPANQFLDHPAFQANWQPHLNGLLHHCISMPTRYPMTTSSQSAEPQSTKCQVARTDLS